MIPFIYLIVVLLVKQFCGFHAITAFATEIFVNAGVSNPRTTVTYATGVANISAVLTALLTVDRLGRKPLLIASGILAGIGALLLGVYFYITRSYLCYEYSSTSNGSASGESYVMADMKDCTVSHGPLAIVGLIIYNFGYSIGFGPLPWVLASEFIPLSVRGKVVGVLNLISFLSSTIVVGFYLQYVELVTLWFAMWTFSIISVAGSVFVLIFIPETKGKSLEAVEREFEGKICTQQVFCIK